MPADINVKASADRILRVMAKAGFTAAIPKQRA
jgi:hypothetical protein